MPQNSIEHRSYNSNWWAVSTGHILNGLAHYFYAYYIGKPTEWRIRFLYKYAGQPEAQRRGISHTLSKKTVSTSGCSDIAHRSIGRRCPLAIVICTPEAWYYTSRRRLQWSLLWTVLRINPTTGFYSASVLNQSVLSFNKLISSSIMLT